MTETKNVTRSVKTAAWVLLALFGAGVLASSVMTWYADTQYPFVDDLITPEHLSQLDSYLTLTNVQDNLEAVLLLAGLVCYPVLMVYGLIKRVSFSAKEKWLYVAITAAAYVVVSVPFSLLTVEFYPVNFYFTPVVLLAVLTVTVAVETGLRAVKSRKKK